MRIYLKKLALSLLIAVLCTNCVLPAFAEEDISGRDRQYLEEGIAASKNSFFQLYRLLWKEYSLDQKLATAIDRGVDEKMGSMMVGTRGIQTLLRSKVAEDAQEIVINQFNPQYEEFMKDLEKRFGEENDRHVAQFYKNIAAEAVNKNENPMIKAYIRQTASEILKDGANALKTQIGEALAKDRRNLYFQGGTTLIGITTTYFSKQISGYIIKKLGLATIGKGLGKKFIESAIPVAGAIMFVWGGVNVLNSVMNAADELKTKLKTGLFEHFITQQPADYWDLMESSVRAIYKEAYSNVCLAIDDANDFANDPEVLALMERYNKEKQ